MGGDGILMVKYKTPFMIAGQRGGANVFVSLFINDPFTNFFIDYTNRTVNNSALFHSVKFAAKIFMPNLSKLL